VTRASLFMRRPFTEIAFLGIFAAFSFIPKLGYFGLIQILSSVNVYRIKPARLAPSPECGV
ncbi:MAG: hypothetical protein ACPGQC_14925, partial [Limisphaerales bacterium]